MEFMNYQLEIQIISIVLVTIVVIMDIYPRIRSLLNLEKGTKIPGEPEIPFFGHTFPLLYNYKRRFHYLSSIAIKYGDIFRIKLIGMNGIVILRPEHVQHVLQINFDNYVKGPLFRERFQELLGNGIFGVDGDLWKFQRKFMSRLFSLRIMRDFMIPVFVSHGNTFLEKVKEIQNKQRSFDIQKLYFCYTMDSIGEIAFGYSVNSLDNYNNNNAVFAEAFDYTNQLINFRFYNPLWKICKWILPSEYKLKKKIKILNDFANDIIMKNREKLINNENKDNSIINDKKEGMNLLIRFLIDEEHNYTDKELRDFILNFMLAGRDTTANALTWTTYYLAIYPEIQDKVYKEVNDVIGENDITFDNLKELKYLENVVNEVLRLCPSVPIDLKVAVHDDILPGGYRVKKGMIVWYMPYMTNRSSKLWDDPDSFDPTRWDFNNNNNKQPTAFEYPTFNAGPRTCLGQKMALLEIKTLISMIIQKYIIKMANKNAVVHYGTSPTFNVEGELRVILEDRISNLNK